MSADRLRVAIVGGGIGGLAAANALSQRGIDVCVYEQAEHLAEVGAGLGLAPNGTRILRRLGLGEAVENHGSRWTDAQYCRLDGTAVAPMLPPSRYIDYFGMHRADLLDVLLANLPGDVVRLGHHCIGFEQDDEHAAVVFTTGTRVTADVVVGADGIHSTLQPHVAAVPEPIHSGSTAYRGVITTESVSWPSGTARLWMGEGKHFLAYPLRANQLLNFVGFVPTSARMKESWSAPGDPAELAQEFAGWDSTVGSIIGQITNTFRWGLYDREPRPAWTNGRLTLLGDAAHPMLPHAGQGANQALEDAITLATLLERADRKRAPAALLAYDALRRERTAEVQRRSRRTGTRLDMPDGQCQRSPHIEPPGSGKLSHPGSPKLSQSGSPILSHPGAAILSHPLGTGRAPCSYPPSSPTVYEQLLRLEGEANGGTEERGDRHQGDRAAGAVGRAGPAHRAGSRHQP